MDYICSGCRRHIVNTTLAKKNAPDHITVHHPCSCHKNPAGKYIRKDVLDGIKKEERKTYKESSKPNGGKPYESES